jgi:flagellar capping protein FliD
LDKEKFESKAAKERPLESVETLQANLDLAKDQYLVIAAKFSDFNKLQAKITLLNSDLTDLKDLKEAKNKGKKKVENEIKTKSDAKLNIARIVKEGNRAKTANEIKEEEGYNKDIDLLQKEIAEKYTSILDKTELKIKLYNAYIDFLKDKGQNEPNINTLLFEKEKKFSDKDTGLLKQLDDLIKNRMTEKDKPENDIKPLTKTIEDLDNEIKELDKATPKDEAKIKAKKLEMENKKKELATINTNLETKLQGLNKVYEDSVIAFREKKQGGGGKLIKRTRKRRHQKKPSKRYILSKHKIKKSKSSRYRKKKYTLRRWKR